MASSRWSLRQQTPGIQLGKRLFASACPNFGSVRVGTGLRQRCGGEQNKSQRIATRRSALLCLCPCPYTDWPSRGSSLIPSLHIASIGCDCFSAKVVPSSLHLPNSLDDPGCFVQGLIQDWRPETDFVPSRFDSIFLFEHGRTVDQSLEDRQNSATNWRTSDWLCVVVSLPVWPGARRGRQGTH